MDGVMQVVHYESLEQIEMTKHVKIPNQEDY